LALVRRSGHLEKIEEFWFDAEYRQICFDNRNLNVEAYGAICRTWRSGAMKETVFTMDDARRAGLLSKDNVWKTYPRRMLQMRTRSGNLKDHFGDVLLGIEITEYDYNYVPVKDVTPEGRVLRNGTVEKDIAATINETLAQTPDSDGDSSAMSLKGKGTAGRPKDSKTPSSSPVQ
jgi:hypothetical protein